MTIADDKWVKVMADYCAEGVWDKEGCAVWECDLPVSEPLRKRLAEWQRVYDLEDTTEPEFSAEGRAIAQAIKRELPDWTVIYYDEAKTPKNWTIGDDRSAFEYEIAVDITSDAK